jgi:hypothetical protein
MSTTGNHDDSARYSRLAQLLVEFSYGAQSEIRIFVSDDLQKWRRRFRGEAGKGRFAQSCRFALLPDERIQWKIFLLTQFDVLKTGSSVQRNHSLNPGAFAIHRFGSRYISLGLLASSHRSEAAAGRSANQSETGGIPRPSGERLRGQIGSPSHLEGELEMKI